MHRKGGKLGHTLTHGRSRHMHSYFLGFLIEIKCSICAYRTSVTAGMSPAGDFLVTSFFVWGSVILGLIGSLLVLRWHGTEPVAAHLWCNRMILLPKGVNGVGHVSSRGRRYCKHAEATMLRQRQAVLNYSIITEFTSYFIARQSFAPY